MLTEREKMISGKDYNAADPELTRARLDCQRALTAINDPNVIDPQERTALAKELFAKLGSTTIMPRFLCDYGFNISIGDGGFINYDAIFLDCAPITLGDHVLIGPRCQLLTAQHPVGDHAARAAGVESAAPITVGDNTWFGGGVIVCPGVTIGENAVIGAGSVVTRDVPPYTFVAGNPAAVKRRLDQD